ncbi:MAG: YeeE/YedE family protein [Yoonia sp.]|uniref:YeeE/YedE family protein n=1 Tax=Yoonia sp. TaxID=2212373 RepID=UPI00273E9226|nr:YeeE/YedE family protein [Yoonia sp.]MDP5085623.1 YeeE/YedE family protein [Yoonia sp.]
MLDVWGDANFAAVVGLFGGILLGLAARLGRFCTLGAIEDYLYGGNDLRLRMWGLAIGTAVIGSFALMGSGLFDPAASFYLSQQWSPLASIVGGGLFGYGMALAGNCGYGAIARLGGGDLRSFVIVLVMGITAYATISGPLAWARVALFPTSPAGQVPNGIAHAIGDLTGLSVAAVGLFIGCLIFVAALAGKSLRKHPASVLWAMVAGFAVVSAWAGMQYVQDNGFDDLPIVSHTFSAPIGDTILYGMLASGLSLSFGIGSVAGVWIGAFMGSLIKGHFRWEACEDPRELRRQIIGAGLMGVGAVIAVGCSIGQGLSAFSLLAFSAPVTFAAMFAGAALGLRQLIVGFAPAID